MKFFILVLLVLIKIENGCAGTNSTVRALECYKSAKNDDFILVNIKKNQSQNIEQILTDFCKGASSSFGPIHCYYKAMQDDEIFVSLKSKRKKFISGKIHAEKLEIMLTELCQGS